jgi:hypothetical protein
VIIKVGDDLASNFGQGPVVAVTPEWIIHRTACGEAAIHRSDGEYWVPVTGAEVGGGGQTATAPEGAGEE